MARQPKRSAVASLHDEAYAGFVQALIRHRKTAKLSQQEVADRLGWQQSVIAKIETVQRRIDVIELIRLAEVVGFDPARLVRETRAAMNDSGHL
jgi:transcriptional regulator with XRE-family HTH domain